MSLRATTTRILLAVLLFIPLATAEGGGIGNAAARGAAKSVSKSVNKGLAQKLRRDLLRDRKAPIRPLQHERHVFRYTTKAQARRELKSGLPPGTHTTSKVTPGRPPAAGTAQKRYGLPQKPQVRETIRLNKGTPVRSARVVGGNRGLGEMTSPKRVPPESIQKVVPLR